MLVQFNGAKLDVFYISDVEGDELSVIGSGIGYYNADLHALSHKQTPELSHHMVASNKIARNAAASEAKNLGFEVICNEECLYEDIFSLAPKLVQKILDGNKGVYIFGGEPTVKLPKIAGIGGRNQSLALAMAEHIYGHDDITIIVAGTDGTDGPTHAAGAIVNGKSFSNPKAALKALEMADANTYLKTIGALFVCAPTGTNVMDIIIAIKK